MLEELGWIKAIENENEEVWIKVEENGESEENGEGSGVELTMVKVGKTGDIIVDSTKEYGAKIEMEEMEEFIEEAKRLRGDWGVNCCFS